MEDRNNTGTDRNQEISAEELLRLLKSNLQATPATEPVTESAPTAQEPVQTWEELPFEEAAEEAVPAVKPARTVYHFRKTKKAPEVIVAAEGRQLAKEIEESEEDDSLDALMKKYLPEEGGMLGFHSAEEPAEPEITEEEARSNEAFEHNSILKEIRVIHDTSVATEEAEQPAEDGYEEYRRRAEQSKIDIKQRISDAEAYVSDISHRQDEETAGVEPEEAAEELFDQLLGVGEEEEAEQTKAFAVAELEEEIPAEEQPTTEIPMAERDKDAVLEDMLDIVLGNEDKIKERSGAGWLEELKKNLFRDAKEAVDHPKRGLIGRYGFEYTETDQNKKIFALYRKDYQCGLWKLLGAVILLIVTFLFENIGLFGGSLPVALNTYVYPVVYTMVSLQLLVLCGALLWKQLKTGAKALKSFKLVPETGILALVALGVIYHIGCLFVGPRGDLRGFNFPVALAAALVLLYDFLNLRREIFSFSVISGKREKFALRKLEGASADLEKHAFVNYLTEDGSMHRVDKTGFVEKFFVNSERNSSGRSLLTVLIPAAVAIALIFGVTAGIVAKDGYTGLSMGYITALLAMPLSVFLTYSYPFFKAAKRAYRLDSAIIGEEAFEAATDAMLVSFDDREVFPSYCVKVKSVKVYGDNRIDKIVYTLASVFHKAGGSLSEVLDLATLELGHSEDVRITEVDEEGLEATVDGSHIYVGKSGYLRKKGFIPVYDQNDDELEEDDSNISIMFLVSENEVAAKIYVEYVIDPDFEFLIKQLYRSDVCVGIRSFDPNINNELLSRKVSLSKYPVKVLKCGCDEEIIATNEKMDTTVVSKHSVKNLLTAFTLCSKVMHVVRIGAMMMIGALILSMVVSGFIIALGGAAGVPSAAVVLYHLFWLAAMLLITKFMI